MENINRQSMSWSIVILAAGKGTRLKSSLPKPLVPIHGKPLVQPIIDHALELSFLERVVVISEYTQAVSTQFPSDQINYVETTPRGTADAVLQALHSVTSDNILIAQSDDSFLYSQDLLEDLMTQHECLNSDFTVGLAEIREEMEYRSGIWNSENQELLGITSEKYSKAGDRVVCGLYAGKTQWIQSVFSQIPASSNGEFGIPTAFLQGIESGDKMHMFPVPANQWIGVNTPQELEKAIHMIDQSQQIR